MKLEAYRCQSCNGIALVDARQMMPNIDLPCPYCFGHPNRNASELVPTVKALKWPDDFAETVRMVVEGSFSKGKAK
jgi:hypothetical protein